MKVLSFRLADALYAIDITFVKEINRNVEFTPAPTANKHIVGLYNMRGSVVTLLNLASILGYETALGKSLTCVILKQQNMQDICGFFIDKPEGVMNLDDKLLMPHPVNVDEKKVQMCLGVFQMENDLLLLVDAKKLFVYGGA